MRVGRGGTRRAETRRRSDASEVHVLALALAAALATLPELPGGDLDPDDADALLEAVLRADARSHRAPAPCEERAGWVGDDDPRDPAPCDDDDDAWLVAPRPGAAEREDPD